MGFRITLQEIIYIAATVVVVVVVVVVLIAESLDSNKIHLEVFLTAFKCGSEGLMAVKIDW
jgi:hypothetical protein